MCLGFWICPDTFSLPPSLPPSLRKQWSAQSLSVLFTFLFVFSLSHKFIGNLQIIKLYLHSALGVLDLLSGCGALHWVVVKFSKFGSRFPCVLCGGFGVRGMQGFLKTWNYQFWNCVEMCGSRLIARVVLCLLSFYIHVLLFLLIMSTFVYFLCPRVAPLFDF